MKKFIKNNIVFVIALFIIVVSAIGYKTYSMTKVDTKLKDKEVVTVILRENEITKGLPELVEGFNEINKDIFIKLEFSNEDYNNVVLTKLANETGVDIIEFMGKTLIEKDFIQPLDNINIDYSNLKRGNLLRFNDDVIGVKYGSSIPKLMYNDDILINSGINPDNKPKTLDELISMLQILKVKNPDIIPMDISIANIHDLFSLLGNASTSEESIYPTFWNYKTGEYDYKALEQVLVKFKYMYDNGLINDNFNEKTEADIFSNFENEKSAITFINSSKKHSIIDRTYNLAVSFSDVPALSEGKNTKYYYTKDRVLVIANNFRNREKLSEENLERLEKHEDAVKEVFEWLLSEDVTYALAKKDANYAAFGENPFKGNRIYDGINDDKNYSISEYDPTEILAANATLVQKAVYAAIKGEKNISEAVTALTSEMNEFISNNKRNDDVDLSKYKE